jgi:hypothetical protein
MRSVHPISSTRLTSGSSTLAPSTMAPISKRRQRKFATLRSHTRQSSDSPSAWSLTSQVPFDSFKIMWSSRKPDCFVRHRIFAGPVKSAHACSSRRVTAQFPRQVPDRRNKGRRPADHGGSCLCHFGPVRTAPAEGSAISNPRRQAENDGRLPPRLPRMFVSQTNNLPAAGPIPHPATVSGSSEVSRAFVLLLAHAEVVRIHLAR